MLANSTFWNTLYQQSQAQRIDQQAMPTVQLHNHLREYANVDATQSDWVASPAAGVVRILLERDGGELTTRATSLVAYQANSQFTPHQHPKGEEFFVLSGTFSDEHGDYPAGSYIRNPPGSSHQPYSQEGCLIFVKLQQFDQNDKQYVVSKIDRKNTIKNINGWQQQILFDDYEKVVFYQTNKTLALPNHLFTNGIEILILAGSLKDNTDTIFNTGHWLRIPPVIEEPLETQFTASPNTQLFIKTQHLGESP